MRWVTGIIALTMALPVRAQQAPAPQHLEVTLTEAIQRALLVQPAMVQAIGADRTAGASKRSALGAYLPSVSVNASTSKGNTGRTDLSTGQFIPPVRSYSGGISANLELFDGFRRAANLKAASASGAAADAGLVNQRFQVTLGTKQAFYNAIATEDLVRVAESQVRRAQQQLQISVEKLRAGSATRSD